MAVNDRWGNDCRGKHGGFFVCEYGGEVSGSCIPNDPTHPWTTHEGMGKSFGYNRIVRPSATPAATVLFACACPVASLPRSRRHECQAGAARGGARDSTPLETSVHTPRLAPPRRPRRPTRCR